jgi:preprotein translocase subunit SecG
MVYLFGALAILASVFMVAAVIIQNSKGGGINSAFGTAGATQMLGARRSDEAIEKITWYLATAIMVFAFLTNVTSVTKETKSTEWLMKEALNGKYIAPTSVPDIAAPAKDGKTAPVENAPAPKK